NAAVASADDRDSSCKIEIAGHRVAPLRVARPTLQHRSIAPSPPRHSSLVGRREFRCCDRFRLVWCCVAERNRRMSRLIDAELENVRTRIVADCVKVQARTWDLIEIEVGGQYRLLL